MNKDVIIKNGIVYVKNHIGEERCVPLVNNLDDILIEENIVEIMEKVIVELEYCSNRFKKERLIDISYIQSPITSTIFLPIIMTYFSTGSLDGVIDTKFGVMDKERFLAMFIAAFTPVALSMAKKWYKEYKDEKKCENGRLLAIYHLKGSLIREKEKLIALKESGVEVRSEDKKYSLNLDSIDVLQDHINMYYELGYNIKEYYDYFRINGCLPDSVLTEYNESGVKIIENYLKNNGCKIKRMKK